MGLLPLAARHLALLTGLAALAAFLYPPAFLIFKEAFLPLFAATMFALGLVLHPEEAKAAAKRPGSIALGVATQYGVMPLLGLGGASIALAAGLSPALALGFVIVGCAPGAMASNVLVYLAGGAVAYSIAMTTVATLLSPLLTPWLVEVLGGAILPIPFWPMVETIVWTVLLPLLVGMGLGRWLPNLRPHFEQGAPGIAAIAIVVICGYAVAANATRLADVGGLTLVLVVAVNALGYGLGWLAGGMAKFDRAYRMTLSIEIGMQNAGLGVALALKHFEPETALPGALFAVWCILTAAGASAYLRSHRPTEA
ncbi:MAG: bile acid:sodium symporter [Alphaproteobacteria bacterium CG_4_10_14_0_2_um_filter_63_37]|nr:MAG: bile acid:sodium symporter [Proteobacteria bacterium CG1_02_64_396]PJA23756.1 MAG: bile acid:sodium symporter [Alphaproteobacteria bacterium CG_4_10_14_0_2_um_filter_63_37]